MGLDKRSTRSSRREALSQLEAPGSASATPSSSQSQRTRSGHSGASSSQRGQSASQSSQGTQRRRPQRREEEEENSSGEEEVEETPQRTTRGRQVTQSQQKQTGQRRRKNDMSDFVVPDSDDDDDEYSTTVGNRGQRRPGADDSDSKETLIRNVMVYLLARQNKMTPITRAEIVRDVMGRQNRNKFKEVLTEVQKALRDLFALKVLGIEDGKVIGTKADSFLLISSVPAEILVKKGEMEVDKVMNALSVILTMIYMGGTPLDADRLYSALRKLEFHEDLCPERENFEKFLKNEYVSKHYLSMKEYTSTSKEGGQKPTYDWGIRAHHEFSKMTMLRTVAKRLNVRDIKSFSYAYAEAKKQMLMYGVYCSAAYQDRGGDSNYSTGTEGSGRTRATAAAGRLDVSQQETQELED